MYILGNYISERQQNCPHLSLQKSAERQYTMAVDTSELMTRSKPERLKNLRRGPWGGVGVSPCRGPCCRPPPLAERMVRNPQHHLGCSGLQSHPVQLQGRVETPPSLAAQRCLWGPSKFSLKKARGASVTQCVQVGAARSYATREAMVMPSILCVSSSSCCCCLLFGKEVHISDCTQTGCLKDRKELPVFFKDRRDIQEKS